MTADDYKLIAAVIGGLGGAYAFITRPMMSEMKAQKAELKKELSDFRLEMHKEFAAVRKEMNDGFAALRKEIHDVEKRLNDRIDAWIVRKN